MRARFARLAFALLVLLTLGFLVPGAQARAQSVAPPPERCLALRTADLLTIPGAPGYVLGAEVLDASKDLPARCRVFGIVGTSVEFSVLLPTATWNGKFAHVGSRFVHVGCSGAECGHALSDAECGGPLNRGYACVVDDEGHRSADDSAAWAAQNTGAKIDFAFRATHLSTVIAKAIVSRYYGRPPARSYFLGCSDAGRQGLVEAQKYPLDYDGVVAGAPPIHYVENELTRLWMATALIGPDGKTLFPTAAGRRFLQPDLQLLRKFVSESCAPKAKAGGGPLRDPRACTLNLDPLQCKSQKTADCLTSDQLAAVRKVFAGPTDDQGRPIYFLHAPPGSEGNWAYSYLPEDGGLSRVTALERDIFQNLDLTGDSAPASGAKDWRSLFERAAVSAALFDAANPDLRAFRDRGGKLIAFQGWSDDEVFPQDIVDYYGQVQRTMGPSQTRAFFRLFMVPGMDHCGNGSGADKVEYLAALEAWVEGGSAPDVLIAAERKPTDDYRFNIFPADARYWLSAPWPKADAVGARPLYPYPLTATYKGAGDPADAANWTSVAPAP